MAWRLLTELTRSTSERNLEGSKVTVGVAPNTRGHVNSSERQRYSSGQHTPHLKAQLSWNAMTCSPSGEP